MQEAGGEADSEHHGVRMNEGPDIAVRPLA